MKRLSITVAMACLLLPTGSASAHRIDEYLQATIVSVDAMHVHASMRLIPGVVIAPSVIAEIDTNGDGVFSDEEQKRYAQRVVSDLALSADGLPVAARLVSWRFPQAAEMRAGLGEIHLEWGAELPRGGVDRRIVLTNHHRSRGSVYLVNAVMPDDPGLRVVGQQRSTDQATYELDYKQSSSGERGAWMESVRTRLCGLQAASLFHLGMRHIAEGTDHLLFLLTLLLPAPLLLAGRRWGAPDAVVQSLRRILGIVTAFTLGHSVTLTLAAFGGLHIPERPIEVLIAVSILVSAVHALRPIVPGKEALIAGLFGLIHGLAFAATLDRLGLGRWERVAGILAFNLGIEAMQMMVVAAVLPSLMLLSRTRLYGLVRVSGALFAGTAAAGWIVERAFAVPLPVDRIVDRLARHGVGLAIGLAMASVAARLLMRSSPGGGGVVESVSGVAA